MSKMIGLLPVGNRVLAKLVEKEKTSADLDIPQGIEPAFCSWAEIVALPKLKTSYLKGLKVGDLVAFSFFAKDKIIHPDTGESYFALEVERDGGVKGQILAVLPRKETV